MTRVTIEQWYDQPIHCPFCGSAIDEEGVGRCEHWLYTAYDSFLHLAKRASDALGVEPQASWDGEISEALVAKFQSNYDAVANIQPKFFNLIEFDISAPSDGTLFGFAPLDREIVYWGNDHVSPYEAIFRNNESQDS